MKMTINVTPVYAMYSKPETFVYPTRSVSADIPMTKRGEPHTKTLKAIVEAVVGERTTTAKASCKDGAATMAPKMFLNALGKVYLVSVTPVTDWRPRPYML